MFEAIVLTIAIGFGLYMIHPALFFVPLGVLILFNN